MKLIDQFEDAWQLLREGKIVAHPTEAVYGLACEPFNEQAVNRLLALKYRSANKGLILLISDWSQLISLTMPISESLLDSVRHTWPGPMTWVFPKSTQVPDWVSGGKDTVAIRMSAHPVAQGLSTQGPVVSTSANLTGQMPVREISTLMDQFPTGVDALLLGDLGNESKPSSIFDVLTGERLR